MGNSAPAKPPPALSLAPGPKNTAFLFALQGIKKSQIISRAGSIVFVDSLPDDMITRGLNLPPLKNPKYSFVHIGKIKIVLLDLIALKILVLRICQAMVQ